MSRSNRMVPYWLSRFSRRVQSHGWIFVLLIAAGTRWWALDAVPPGLKYDTASSGVYALNVLFNGARPFYVNPSGASEPLMVYLQALGIALFGVNAFALRFLSAAAGILVVALLYALARETTRDTRVALIAAFALAVAVEPTHVTRTGLRATLVPLFETAWLLLFWRGWRTAEWRYFIATGAILGLGFYTYLAALAVPLIAAGLWVHQFLFARARWRARLLPTGTLVLVMFVLVLPRLVFQFSFPQAAVQRAAQVSLFQNPDVTTLGVLGALGRHALEELSLFGLAWQGELYNVLHHPLLDPFLFFCFLIGLLVCLRRGKRMTYAWALLSLVLMLLPDLLGANEPSPNELRTIGVVPPAYFLVGVGAVAALDLASRFDVLRAVIPAPGLTGLLLLGLTVSSIAGLWDYWGVYAAAVREGPDEDYNRTEIAQAQWIAQQREAVLMPLNEYARSPIHFLVGSRAAVLQSALDVGTNRSLHSLPAHAWVLLPLDETRPRTEGKDYVPDPAAFVWVDADRVRILPPAQRDVQAALAGREPTAEIRDSLGQVVAHAFWVDDPSALFQFEAPGSQPSVAQFSEGITLVAAAVDRAVLEPGDSVGVSLFWRAARPISDDQVIFVHALDVHSDTVAGLDVIPALGVYPTYLWKPGELVATHHVLKLPAKADPGTYRVEVGLYNILNQERLDVTDLAEQSVDSRVVVGAFELDVDHTTMPQPGHTQTADFGSAIRLLGWDAPASAGPGKDVAVTLYWQATAPVSRDYTIFAHLLDANGKIVAQSDHQPFDGQYPTSLWPVGRPVIDRFSISIPPGVASGDYALKVGWYDWQTGRRLPLVDGTDYLILNAPLRLQP